jgi:small subunit ribosomal protein S20
MANIKSAAKAARQAIKRTAINKARLSRIRTHVRKVEEAIQAGDQKAALAALKAAEPEIMRGATKGVVAKNAASRKVSRLTKRVKSLGAK